MANARSKEVLKEDDQRTVVRLVAANNVEGVQVVGVQIDVNNLLLGFSARRCESH